MLVSLVERLAMWIACYGTSLSKLYASRADRINADLNLIYGKNIGDVAMDYIARPSNQLLGSSLYPGHPRPQEGRRRRLHGGQPIYRRAEGEDQQRVAQPFSSSPR